MLLPVVVSTESPVSESTFIEIRVGEMLLRVAMGTDVQYLAALVAALRG
jgi:hypothetical protein